MPHGNPKANIFSRITNTKKGNRAYQHGKPPIIKVDRTRGEKETVEL